MHSCVEQSNELILYYGGWGGKLNCSIHVFWIWVKYVKVVGDVENVFYLLN